MSDTDSRPGTKSGMAAPDMDIIVQPSFAKSFPTQDADHGMYEWLVTTAGDFLGFWGMFPCCICCPNPMQTVQQGNVGIIQKFGQCIKVVDPGLYSINPLTETIDSQSIRLNVADIPRQYVMSKDNVNLKIDSVLYWHVVDPYSASFAVGDVKMALVERTQTTLRQIVGQRTLQDAIENRDTIALEIKNIIEEPCKTWGVQVESILIKDLEFSRELLETLSSGAKQKRIGEAKIIAAQAEVESAKLMREAADILNTNPAMQIRYLDTLNSMARSAGQKVIFMPLDATVSKGAEELTSKVKVDMK